MKRYGNKLQFLSSNSTFSFKTLKAQSKNIICRKNSLQKNSLISKWSDFCDLQKMAKMGVGLWDWNFLGGFFLEVAMIPNSVKTGLLP